MSICHPDESYPPDAVKVRGQQTLPPELHCRTSYLLGDPMPMAHFTVPTYRWTWRGKERRAVCICGKTFSAPFADMLAELDVRRITAWYAIERHSGQPLANDDPIYDEFFEVTYQ